MILQPRRPMVAVFRADDGGTMGTKEVLHWLAESERDKGRPQYGRFKSIVGMVRDSTRGGLIAAPALSRKGFVFSGYQPREDLSK